MTGSAGQLSVPCRPRHDHLHPRRACSVQCSCCRRLITFHKNVSCYNSLIFSAQLPPLTAPPPATPPSPPQPYSYQYGVQDEYSGTNFAANEKSDTKARHFDWILFL